MYLATPESLPGVAKLATLIPLYPRQTVWGLLPVASSH